MSTKERTIGFMAIDSALYDFVNDFFDCEAFAVNVMQHEGSREMARGLYHMQIGLSVLKPKFQKKVMADHEAVVLPIINALIKSVNKNTSGQFGRADLN